MTNWLSGRKIFFISLLGVILSASVYSLSAQTLRNPVLEFCTGVW